jgi:hypothetical protein
MSTVCILTPIVIGSWPMIASAVAGAASALGYTMATAEHPDVTKARSTVETEVPNSEVLAEVLERGEKIRIVKPGVVIEFGVDDRGACTVCVTGDHDKAALRKIGEEVAGRVVQQFAYHKLVTELKARHYDVVEETVQQDDSIQVRVRLDR